MLWPHPPETRDVGDDGQTGSTVMT